MKQLLIYLACLFGLSSCYKELPLPGQIIIETPDWTETSHGPDVPPDYQTVFPADQVNRLDIVISSEDWSVFWDRLVDMLGPFGRGQPGMIERKEHEFIPCSVFFNGKEWYQVGIRAKGNSSLKSSWSQGIMKLPFKLDFDQYEDIYPDINNQRFYGFRQLSLKNAFSDPSLIREKVVDEIFGEAGLPSIRAAFYRVFIDRGEGSQYFGLYTLVEDVDDVFLSREFTDPSGYLYKPEGMGAKLSNIQISLGDFEQHQNGELSDFSDIQTLLNALHDPIRESHPVGWRNQLEGILDTDTFIKWLACNTTVQNWDTYGMMSHNYYLYHDPSQQALVWIHWDNNEALLPGKFNRMAPDFDLETVGSDWPLIRYLIDNEVYQHKYKEEISNFITTVFYPEKIIPLLMSNMDLIAPYVLGPEGEEFPYSQLRRPEDFTRERNFIREFALKRYREASSYIGN